MKKSEKIKKEKIDNVGIHAFSKPANLFFSILIGIIALSCILPFIFVIMISITNESVIATNGFSFWPSKFGFDGYLFLVQFKDKILNSLFITLFVTAVGTSVNVFMTTTYAYAISRRTFKYKRFFTVFALITMLFNAGMIPGYIVVTQLLRIGDTIAALIIPLALPGIATISLFTALAYWNDWFNALLYIKNPDFYPLQYLLMQIQSNMDYIAKSAGLSSQVVGAASGLPKETGRMAMVVVATLPIAMLYPFFQRYFVKGLTIGGVKE